MDTKISSDFWSDPDIEAAAGETKYAALWLLTNARINLCGYAEVTPERFAFETKALPEGLGRALGALSKSFLIVGKGYWARNFIGYQFGRGERLAKNNMRFPIAEVLRGLSPEIQTVVLREYPELQDAFDTACFKALPKPSPTPPQGGREGAGEGERAGAGAGAGAGENDSDRSQPGSTRQKKNRGAAKSRPGFVLPAEQPVAIGQRMVRVGALKRRGETTAWSADEWAAFRAARLDVLTSEDFDAQVETLRGYYHAVIPREKDYRRRDLKTLLNNWPGEIDRARQWTRDNGDNLRRL